MRQIERASQLSEGRFSEKSFRSELRDLSLTRVVSSISQCPESVNILQRGSINLIAKLEQRERTKEIIAGLKLPWQCSVIGCKNAVYPDFQALLAFLEQGTVLCEPHHFGRKYQGQLLSCSKLCEDQIQARLNAVTIKCQSCESRQTNINKIYIRQYLLYGEFRCVDCREKERRQGDFFSVPTNGNGHNHLNHLSEGGNGSMKLRMKPANFVTKATHILQGSCRCYYVFPNGIRCSNLVNLNNPKVRDHYLRLGQAFCSYCLPKVQAGKRLKRLRQLVRL